MIPETLLEELKSAELPELSEELFSLFEREGNRVKYEAVYFERRKLLAVFGLNAIKQHIVSEKLIQIIEGICDEETWALPAHCNREKDPDWRHTVDLFNCETGCALALIYNDLKDILPEKLWKRMLDEIYSRVISPFFFENKQFGWEGAHHNWNAVCGGSIGVILLCAPELVKDKMPVEEALGRINRSLNTYIDKGFSEDGACLEGMGYYNYGLSFFLGYARRLRNFTKGKMNLLDNAKLRLIAEFPKAIYFRQGSVVNFSDADTDEKIYRGIIKIFEDLYDIKYNLPECVFAEFDTDTCYRFITLYDDMACDASEVPMEGLPETEGKIARTNLLEAAQWLICENQQGAGFAIKGGNNDEPHNHNDVGSYVLYSDSGAVVCDLGKGVYTKDYFGAGRYDILCCSSLGHSLPVIGGQGQKAGATHRADSFEVIEDEKKVTVKIDMTSAYDIPKVKRVLRTAVFYKEPGDFKGGILKNVLVVRDEVHTDQDFEDSQMHTRVISRIKNMKNLNVRMANEYIRYGDSATAEPCPNYSFSCEKHMNHQDEPEEIYVYKIPFCEGEQKEGYKEFVIEYSLAI